MKNGKNGHPKIEKGVPIPDANYKTWGVITPFLKQMEPGDSVEVPSDYNGAYQAASRQFGRGNFIIRATDGKRCADTKRVRIWRRA